MFHTAKFISGLDTRKLAAKAKGFAVRTSPLAAAIDQKSTKPIWNAFGSTIPNAQNGFVPMGSTRSMKSMQKYVSPEAIKKGSDEFLSYVKQSEAADKARMMKQIVADRIAKRNAAIASERARIGRLSVMQRFAPKITDQDMIRKYLSSLYQ